MERPIAPLLCVVSVLFNTGMPFQSEGEAELHFDICVLSAISAMALISSGSLSHGEFLTARIDARVKKQPALGKY